MHDQVTIPELTEIVARLAALLGRHEGVVVQLEGAITNRNFRVRFGGTDYVVRLPGKKANALGIDREAERVAAKAAAGLDIAPAVAATLEDPPCLVTIFVPGRRPSAEDLRAPELVEAVGTSLHAFHDSSTKLPANFDAVALADDYANIAAEHGIEPPPGFAEGRRRARAIRRAVEKHPEHAPVPCHNDLLTSNFILDPDDRLRIIDWEYARMGDRFFDLGNFAVDNGLTEADEERLLGAYFGEPPGPRRLAALRLYRYVSDLREAMWGVVQTALSELDFDFGSYAARHFERLEDTGADPRFESWLRDARG